MGALHPSCLPMPTQPPCGTIFTPHIPSPTPVWDRSRSIKAASPGTVPGAESLGLKLELKCGQGSNSSALKPGQVT